jgi:hypothetical protein
VVCPQNHSDGFRRFGLKTGGDSFSSVWPSKPTATVCEWFGLKTIRTVFADLGLKPVVTVSSGLASKPTTTVSWFGPQNQAGFGLSVAPQN